MHKASRRRTWRKVHIAMYPVTQQITYCILTLSTVHDSQAFFQLVKLYPKLAWRNQAEQFTNPREGIIDWNAFQRYHLRSLVETTIMRFKRIFSDKLNSWLLSTQKTEACIKHLILNKFIEMGLPHTVSVPYPPVKK